jgi:4-amino-4-deoxy-L-arabinose transferase-like glycosyltransferase
MITLPRPSKVSRRAGTTSLPHGALALAFLVSLWAVFGHLGDFPLLAPDEGRNAEVAREMSASGAWLVPTYLGATYLDKPAFFFRAVALSMDLFGASAGAARLPSALFGFGLLVALFAFCRRVYDERTAALALVIAATTPLFMAFSRIVIFDMTLGFFVGSAIFAAYLAEEHEGPPRTRWYLAAAAAGGFATLVKGPVGFLIPLLVMAVFHGSLRDTAALRRLFAPAHWGVFLALVLPWFVGLSLACPDFPYYGIMKESIARFTTPEFRRTAPFYFYGLIIAGCFFSWSLLLPEAVAAAWRRRGRLSRPDRLFIVWAVVVVVFFSLSKSKLPGYILTGVVALGVLTARVFASALQDPQGQAARLVRHGTAALLALAVPAALVMAVIALHPDLLERRLRFPHEIFERFVPLFPMVAWSLAGVALLTAVAWKFRDLRLSFAAFLVAPLLPITADFELLPRFAEARSGHSLAEALPKSLPPDTKLACLRCLPNGLPFYRRQLLTVLSDDGKELTSNYVLFSLASGKPWPERIVPFQQRDLWLAGRTHPVYLMARKEQSAELEALAGRHGLATTEVNASYRAVLFPAPASAPEAH